MYRKIYVKNLTNKVFDRTSFSVHCKIWVKCRNKKNQTSMLNTFGQNVPRKAGFFPWVV